MANIVMYHEQATNHNSLSKQHHLEFALLHFFCRTGLYTYIYLSIILKTKTSDMKKILFAAFILLTIAACNDNDKKEDEASSKNTEMKALYEKNLTTVKAFTAAFEKEDITGVAALIADTAVWTSAAYGDKDSTKAHWVESLKYYVDNWDKLHLANAQFLPGLDPATHEFDGSVRYYGQWEGVHTSGVNTSVNFYGTYNFNKDNKLISGADYFDLGGLMNSLKPMDK